MAHVPAKNQDGLKQLARAAYSGAALPVTSPQECTAIAEVLAEQFKPMNQIDKRFRSLNPVAIQQAIAANPDTPAILEGLKMIGRNIMPNASEETAAHWCGSIIAALSDLPATVVLPAVKDALHLPLKFGNEVHPAIRECAKKHQASYETAQLRLKNLKRELENPKQPRLPAPEPTVEELIETNYFFRKIGSPMRYFPETGETRDLLPDEADPCDTYAKNESLPEMRN